MKNLFLGLGALVVVVLVLAGIYWVVSNNQPDGAETARLALLGSGSAVCEFEDSVLGDSGTLYVKDGLIRGDITDSNISPVGGGNVSMIIKNSQVYFWSADGGSGMRLPLDQDGIQGPFPNISNAELFAQELVEYNIVCQADSVSADLFVLPAEVEFFNPLEQMLNNFGGGSNTNPSLDEIDESEMEEMMRELELEMELAE